MAIKVTIGAFGNAKRPMDIQSKWIGRGHRRRISWKWVEASALLLVAAMPSDGNAAPPPSFAERLLASHNAERAKMGVTPLTWSATLARDAGIWADHLAKTSTFEHAPQPNGAKAQGENLWSGSKADYTPEEMVQLWIDEKANYQRGRFPSISKTGNWRDVGHYTQLIWYNTTQVGCALASNAEEDYLVCRYSPAGNWIGEDAQGKSVAIRTDSARKRHRSPR